MSQWLLIAGVALFASLGQILMTSAYRHDRAPAVAAASYSSVILSVVYGYFFWGETPNPLAWLGGVLIIAGGVLLVKSRHGVSEPAAVIKTSLQQGGRS
jgi:drug/metabolite transporter (DMT)-like permease